MSRRNVRGSEKETKKGKIGGGGGIGGQTVGRKSSETETKPVVKIRSEINRISGASTWHPRKTTQVL